MMRFQFCLIACWMALGWGCAEPYAEPSPGDWSATQYPLVEVWCGLERCASGTTLPLPLEGLEMLIRNVGTADLLVESWELDGIGSQPLRLPTSLGTDEGYEFRVRLVPGPRPAELRVVSDAQDEPVFLLFFTE